MADYTVISTESKQLEKIIGLLIKILDRLDNDFVSLPVLTEERPSPFNVETVLLASAGKAKKEKKICAVCGNTHDRPVDYAICARKNKKE